MPPEIKFLSNVLIAIYGSMVGRHPFASSVLFLSTIILHFVDLKIAWVFDHGRVSYAG